MAKQTLVRSHLAFRRLNPLVRVILLGICTALLVWGIAGQRSLLAQAPPSPPALSQTLETPSQWVQRGRDRYQAGQYTEAAALWRQASQAFAAAGDRLNQAMALSNLALAEQQLGQGAEANQAIEESLRLLDNLAVGDGHDRLGGMAQALTNQGIVLLAQGQAEKALEVWHQAGQLYQQLGDQAALTQLRLNQAEALQTLGLYQRAREVLEQGNQALQAQPPSQAKVEGLLALGDIQQAIGNLKLSQTLLEQALTTAQALKPSPEMAAILLSLGNNARLQKQIYDALQYYQQALAAAPDPEVALEVQLNQVQVLMDSAKWAEAESLLPRLQAQLSQLPASRPGVYAQINYAQSLSRFYRSRPAGADGRPPDQQQSATILARALQQARELGDRRAESYALGDLGHLYEQTQQFQEAQKLTEQALGLAQLSNTAEISYRWQWQLGRILKARSDQEGNQPGLYAKAIDAYTEAIRTLQTLRGDLAATNQAVQFSFRESVEPVYRQLVSLLLLQAETPALGQKNLKQAREVLESLQLAELDNFFREACLNATPRQIDQVDPQAAVFYPVILPDRLEVILSQPNQPLRHYSSPIPQKDLDALVNQMRLSLDSSTLPRERLPIAQQIYELLIRPAEAALQAQGAKTLAFVLDGSLRTLPMAALYDGQQYLVEKYAIALTPSLQLLEPQPLARQRFNVLIGGITESIQGHAALPGVAQEVQKIEAEVPAQVLLNQAFTRAAIQEQITATPFRVVHLATHGEFSSDVENTYILVWDRRLTVRELGDLLRARSERDTTPIELLVLSACKTALGDDRAALGLAGVAVRSGARSTLATLWEVNDLATAAFMAQFYQELVQSKVTRAEAVQQAQLALLKQPEFNHPYYWAPFVLVGNWL